MKAFAYTRISTAEQREGHGLKRQDEAAVRWCSERGVELDRSLDLTDLGVSAFRGKNAETGALRGFLRAVEDGVVEAPCYLLVERLDRISRQSARKATRILEEIVEAGVLLVTLADGKVWNESRLDSFDWIMASVMLFQAHSESRVKSERVGKAWAAKRESGRPLTKRTPAWLKLEADHTTYTFVEPHVSTVRSIFDRYAAGVTLGEIVRELNEGGVPTFNGRGYWSRDRVADVLRNEAAIGTLRVGTCRGRSGRGRDRRVVERREGWFPSAVSAETWARVRALRATRAPRRGGGGTRTLRNVFAGLLDCSRCGGSAVLKAHAGRGYDYVVCRRARNAAGCTYTGMRYDRIAAAVLRDREWIVHELTGAPANTDLARKIEQAEVLLEVVVGDGTDIAHALARNPDSVILGNRLREIEAQREAVEEDLRKLRAEWATVSPAIVDARGRELAAELEREPWDPEAVNGALRGLVKRMVVGYDDGTLSFEAHHGATCSVMAEWRESQ